MKQEIFLGNGAIALGLMEAGCQVMTSYPGTQFGDTARSHPPGKI